MKTNRKKVLKTPSSFTVITKNQVKCGVDQRMFKLLLCSLEAAFRSDSAYIEYLQFLSSKDVIPLFIRILKHGTHVLKEVNSSLLRCLGLQCASQHFIKT
jgi:hypothetical protein